MNEAKIRGFSHEDVKLFSDSRLAHLNKAYEEVTWLLDRGYPLKSCLTFVANHYMLHERQRNAIMRSVCTEQSKLIRESKKIEVVDLQGRHIHVDGFNLIITLEVILSGGFIIHCADGTYRDLAGLRGTYHIIDKTELALEILGKLFTEMQIAGLTIYLDAPVSNSGRLKTKIAEILGERNFELNIEIVINPDVILSSEQYVVTSDAIILDKCTSWVNLVRFMLDKGIVESSHSISFL